MSLESDPQYQQMLAEKQKLEATQMKNQHSFLVVSCSNKTPNYRPMYLSFL